MRSIRSLTWTDLILLGVSAACIAAVATLSTPTVRVIAGLPLTLYLPGAGLVSLINSRRHRASAVERQVWIIGASLALTVAGGLVLNLTPIGLNRSSWLVCIGSEIGAINLLKILLFLYQTASTTPNVDRGTPETDQEVVSAPPEMGGEAPGSKWVSFRRVALLLCAGAICAAALVLSVHTNSATTREHFVEAWVLPRPSEDVTSTTVELGLRNHTGAARTFLVHVTVGGALADLFSVPLANGASWTHVIKRGPGQEVESTIFRSSQPTVVVTRVYLATPVT